MNSDNDLIKEYIKDDKTNVKHETQLLNMIRNGVATKTIAKRMSSNRFDTHLICTKETIIRAIKDDLTDKFANKYVYTKATKKANQRAYHIALNMNDNKYYYVNYNIEMTYHHPSFKLVTRQLLLKLVKYDLKACKNTLKMDLPNKTNNNNKVSKESKKPKVIDIPDNDLPF